MLADKVEHWIVAARIENLLGPAIATQSHVNWRLSHESTPRRKSCNNAAGEKYPVEMTTVGSCICVQRGPGVLEQENDQ